MLKDILEVILARPGCTTCVPTNWCPEIENWFRYEKYGRIEVFGKVLPDE